MAGLSGTVEDYEASTVPGRARPLALLPMALGAACPVTSFELVAVADVVPAVGRPGVPGAHAHRVTTDPHMLTALPAPVSRRPGITMALDRNHFDAGRGRGYFDDDAAGERRSGRNAANEDQRQQQAPGGFGPRAVQPPAYAACSHCR